MLELHVKTKENYDSKGELLFLSLTEITNIKKQQVKSYTPDVNVAANVTPKDIIDGDIDSRQIDEYGIAVSRWFAYQNSQISLDIEKYKILRELAEKIQKNKEISERVSTKFIENTIFEWLKAKYKKFTEQSLSDFIIDSCNKSIKEYEIWIPIAGLSVESGFQVGKVIFRTITREMLDIYMNGICEKVQGQCSEEMFKQLSDRERKIQGYAAAVVKVESEPLRAREVSYNLTEEALAVLRSLSPFNKSHLRICYCMPFGHENVEVYKYFYVDENELKNQMQGIENSNIQPWFINNQEIQSLQEHGLNIISDVLKKNNRSNFQEEVLKSLMLYSKSCLMKEPNDKLVYILVALESLLLKNTTEPISVNLSTRMSFVIGQDKDDRKRIIALVKKIYDIRSKFIHHGDRVSIEEGEKLDEFFFDSFNFFNKMIVDFNKYSTKVLFIEELQNRILS